MTFDKAAYQLEYMRRRRAGQPTSRVSLLCKELALAGERISELEQRCATFEGEALDFQAEIECLHETLNDRVEWAGQLQDGITLILAAVGSRETPVAKQIRAIAEQALTPPKRAMKEMGDE